MFRFVFSLGYHNLYHLQCRCLNISPKVLNQRDAGYVEYCNCSSLMFFLNVADTGVLSELSEAYLKNVITPQSRTSEVLIRMPNSRRQAAETFVGSPVK